VGSEKTTGILPSMPGIVDGGGSLRSGFAYLIRSKLRMPELYPFLGELLFCTRATEDGVSLDGENGWETCTNVVGMFIDDDRTNFFSALGATGDTAEKIDTNFVTEIVDSDAPRGCLPEFAAWLDTYGTFAKTETEASRLFHESWLPPWLSQSIVGAGNPMSIYRFFRSISAHEAIGSVNIYLLNSLSNLYRNLGLSETAALLKKMLEDVWRRNATDGGRIGDKDGLFFAVLQEGVMEPAQASYLESFFDGVLKLEPYRFGNLRIARLRVESLPLQSRLPENVLFLPTWQEDLLPIGSGDPNIDALRDRRLGRSCYVSVYGVPDPAPVPKVSLVDP